MKDKPQPKREVAVIYALPGADIYFSASPDALQDIKEFGTLWQSADSSCWHLSPDPRFNFDEVLEYIKSYG